MNTLGKFAGWIDTILPGVPVSQNVQHLARKSQCVERMAYHTRVIVN